MQRKGAGVKLRAQIALVDSAERTDTRYTASPMLGQINSSHSYGWMMVAKMTVRSEVCGGIGSKGNKCITKQNQINYWG